MLSHIRRTNKKLADDLEEVTKNRLASHVRALSEEKRTVYLDSLTKEESAAMIARIASLPEK